MKSGSAFALGTGTTFAGSSGNGSSGGGGGFLLRTCSNVLNQLRHRSHSPTHRLLLRTNGALAQALSRPRRSPRPRPRAQQGSVLHAERIAQRVCRGAQGAPTSGCFAAAMTGAHFTGDASSSSSSSSSSSTCHGSCRCALASDCL